MTQRALRVHAGSTKPSSKVNNVLKWMLISFLASSIAFNTGAHGTSAPPDRPDEVPGRPNIVLVVVDDLGWSDFDLEATSATGNRPALRSVLRTPNVRNLAARGMTFTDAYAAAPVCTPSRAAIMTGVAPARSHVTWWILNAGQDTSRRHPTLDPPAWATDGVQSDTDAPAEGAGGKSHRAPTLAAKLKSSGYHTIHVGKAHLGAIGTAGADPVNLGFDVNVAGHGAGAPGSYFGLHHFRQAGRSGKPLDEAPPSVWDVPGLEAWHGKDVYLTDVLAEEAVRHVHDAQSRGEPFFLHFAPYAVHTPIMAHPDGLETIRNRADDSDLPGVECAYASMIEAVDRAIGDILAVCPENTFVIVTSDNGGLSAHGRGGAAHMHNLPLRSGKGSAYEGGVRVPLVAAWPGFIRNGSTCDTPVIGTDLFATILSAARIASTAPDARDLMPLIREEEDAAAPFLSRPLLWHQPHQWGADGPGIAPFSAIRVGNLKLIWTHASGAIELFDVVQDPGETNDLAANPAFAAERTTMLVRLGQALRDSNAQWSIRRSDAEPVLPPSE